MNLTINKLRKILIKEQKKIDEMWIDPSSKENVKITLNNLAVEIKKFLEKKDIEARQDALGVKE